MDKSDTQDYLDGPATEDIHIRMNKGLKNAVMHQAQKEQRSVTNWIIKTIVDALDKTE